MNIISGINLTSSALSAEKVRMDLVAQNIANAHTTHDIDGQAYKRKVVSFESIIEPEFRRRQKRPHRPDLERHLDRRNDFQSRPPGRGQGRHGADA